MPHYPARFIAICNLECYRGPSVINAQAASPPQAGLKLNLTKYPSSLVVHGDTQRVVSPGLLDIRNFCNLDSSKYPMSNHGHLTHGELKEQQRNFWSRSRKFVSDKRNMYTVYSTCAARELIKL